MGLRMGTVSTSTTLDVSAAVFDQGKVVLEHLELAERAAGEIDVAISTAAICGSDLHTMRGHRFVADRTVLGHEGVGHVIAADDDAADLHGAPLQPGDRIVFALSSSCGSCDRCRRGLTMKCRSLVKYGHEPITKPPYATGTLATHVRLLPRVAICRVPPDVTDAQVVSAGCAAATAAAIVAAARPGVIAGVGATPGPGVSAPHPEADGRVLVFGAGAVGAYCTAMLTSLGYSVSVHDPSDVRLAIVTELGAHPRSPSELDGTRFPIVVEASGNPDAFTNALHATDLGGHLVAAGSVSPGSSTVTVDPALLVTNRLTISGIHNYTAENFRWGVDWLLQYGRDMGLERLVSPPFPLSVVSEAFQQMEAGHYPRVLVQPEATEVSW